MKTMNKNLAKPRPSKLAPQPLAEMPKTFCKKLRGIFTDIDDTLTHHGKVPEDSYKALWMAREAGLRLIPVTGRPAGWVDHLARMWPVDAVIGENGAFYFHLDKKQGRDGKLLQRFVQDSNTRKANQEKLWQVFHALKREIPEIQVASDQGYRAIDLAVDFCEDVPRLSEEKIDRIVSTFQAAGAQAQISSIHVNAWFGSHDKYSCCKLLLKELYGENFDSVKENYLYFGDSPNDEPLFQKFPHTVGVANVQEFLPRMKYHPRYITKKAGGHGFAEAIKFILKNR